MKELTILSSGVEKISKAKGQWGYSSRMIVLKMRREAIERLKAKGLFTPTQADGAQ